MRPRLLPAADVIYVDVGTDRFVFRTPRQEFSLPATIAADPQGDRRDLLLRHARLPATPVRIFGAAPPGSEPFARPRLLAAHLRRALLVCTDDRFLKLKPHLVFRRAETLDDVLSGFQYEILAHAAFYAGARSVRFEAASGCPLPPEYAGSLQPDNVLPAVHRDR